PVKSSNSFPNFSTNLYTTPQPLNFGKLGLSTTFNIQLILLLISLVFSYGWWSNTTTLIPLSVSLLIYSLSPLPASTTNNQSNSSSTNFSTFSSFKPCILSLFIYLLTFIRFLFK